MVLVLVLTVAAVAFWPDRADPNSEDAEERLRAIAQLSGRTDDESTNTLLSLTGDPKPHVAIAAVKAIAAAPRFSHAPLQRVLSRADSSPPARAEAAAALGKCPKADVEVSVLTKILVSKTQDPQVRAGAARGLARRRDKTALNELVEALEDTDPRVRLWAITAIGRTTALRFEYDAWTSPAKQQDELRFIKETLRRRTSYK